MSTKIDGYIFDKNYTFEELLEWCKKSKKIFLDELNAKAKNDYIKIATNILDRSFYLSKKQLDEYVKEKYFIDNLSYGFSAFQMRLIGNKYEEKDERYYSDFYYKLECCLLSSNEHKLIMFCGNTFNLLPTYKDDAETELIDGKIKNIIPFHYYNNVDHEIDDESFKKRGLIWEEALTTGVPSNDGFTFSLTSSKDINFFYNREDTFEQVPYEDRIKKNTNIILNMVFDNRFKKKKIDTEKGNVVSVYLDEYEKFKLSEDCKKLRIKIEAFLRSKLPENYNDFIGTSTNLSENDYKYIVKE